MPAGRTLTHTLLDVFATGNGVLSVFDSHRESFYIEYTKTLQGPPNRQPYISEYATNDPNGPRRMYLDIDLKLPPNEYTIPLLELIANDIIEPIISCMDRISGCSLSPCIVTHSGLNPQKLKIGIHMVWPTIYVTKSGTLRLRRFIVNVLEKAYGQIGTIQGIRLIEAWKVVIDEAVLTNCCLRMIGSRKVRILTDAERKARPRQRSPCMCSSDILNQYGCICFKGVLIDGGGPHRLWRVYTGIELDADKFEFYSLPLNLIELVKDSSIWAPSHQLCTELDDTNDDDLIMTESLERDKDGDDKRVCLSDDHLKTITEYVRHFWTPWFNDCNRQITAEKYTPPKSEDRPENKRNKSIGYRVHFKNSRRCFNTVGGAHSSMSSCILITKYGVKFHCFSKKGGPNRLICNCSDIRKVTKMLTLPNGIKTKLFGSTKRTSK